MTVAVRTAHPAALPPDGAPTRQIDGVDISVDLGDPGLYAHGEPERLWAVLRRHRPVHWNVRSDRPGFWAVTRYAEAVQVLRDTTRFASEKGMRLDADPAANTAAAGRMLIVTDPPRHGPMRRALAKAFTPRTVARLRESMHTYVNEALDLMAERSVAGEPTEFTEVASRLPVAVICDLLGVPAQDHDFMLDRTRIAFGEVPDTRASADPMAISRAHADILSYYVGLVRSRRADPRDDIVTAMVHADMGGRPMTDLEIYLNCNGLISGGIETTRHASVGGLLALIGNPRQWDRLHADPGAVDGAVAEILRYTSPAMHVLRTAKADTTVGEQPVREGDQVTVWLAAANRDPAVFTDPERFDIGRNPNPHLAFGIGGHHCIGSALARTELSVLVGELVRRFRGAETAGPPRRLPSTLIRGYGSLPVLAHVR